MWPFPKKPAAATPKALDASVPLTPDHEYVGRVWFLLNNSKDCEWQKVSVNREGGQFWCGSWKSNDDPKNKTKYYLILQPGGKIAGSDNYKWVKYEDIEGLTDAEAPSVQALS